MCGVAEAGLALSAMSAVTTAYGQYQQGQAASARADYEAAIQRNNAIRADQLAEDAIRRGEEAEKDERLRGRLLIGQMRAALAGSGQVIDEGSAGEMVVDQAGTNKLDELRIRNNAQREAQGYRIQAANSRSEADLTQLAGRNKRSAGRAAAAGTVLGGAGKVAGKWYQLDREGALA